MRVAIPPLLQYAITASEKLKHRDNFTFTINLPPQLGDSKLEFGKIYPDFYVFILFFPDNCRYHYKIDYNSPLPKVRFNVSFFLLLLMKLSVDTREDTRNTTVHESCKCSSAHVIGLHVNLLQMKFNYCRTNHTAYVIMQRH